MEEYKNTLHIVFDNKIYNEYIDYYFKKYPRRSKKPIDSPLHPSINKWFILKRPMMNDMKQKWKDFTIWVINYYGYKNLNINKCRMTYKFYYGNKRRRDNDNVTPKFTNDGLVESNVILDDDYKIVNPLIIEGCYDKENPRMEIIIEY